MPRVLFLLLMLGGALCLGVTAKAQQQDERISKILNPDKNKGFDLSMEKRFGTSHFDSRTSKVIDLKTVSESRKFGIKSFLTGKFRNDKTFWMGDFKYSGTNEANIQPSHLFTLPEKNYSAKTVAVKSMTGIDKHYESATVPTRDFRGKESERLRTQLTPEQAANNGYRGDLKELKSIDDVRNLLNKNK